MDNNDPSKLADRLSASLMALDLATIAEQDIEAILLPYIKQMQIDQQVGKSIAARQQCMGIVLALYRFDSAVVIESDLLPSDTILMIAEEAVFTWKAGADRDDMAAVMAFIEVEIGEWGRRLV